MYITATRYARIVDLPVALPQTEVRRGKQIILGRVTLALGQLLRIRSLVLHVIRNLTPGPLPSSMNTTLGIASVGIYLGPMLTSSPALVRGPTTGSFALNSFGLHDIVTPGNYTVIVANHTDNFDLSVIVTGSLKLYA